MFSIGRTVRSRDSWQVRNMDEAKTQLSLAELWNCVVRQSRFVCNLCSLTKPVQADNGSREEQERLAWHTVAVMTQWLSSEPLSQKEIEKCPEHPMRGHRIPILQLAFRGGVSQLQLPFTPSRILGWPAHPGVDH